MIFRKKSINVKSIFMRKFILVFVVLSFRSFAQELSTPSQEEFKSVKFLKDQIRSSPKDLKKIFLYPIKNSKETALFSAISLGLVISDKVTTDFVQDRINPIFDFRLHSLRYLPISGITSDTQFLLSGLIALYGGSLITGSQRGQVAAVLSTKSMIYSYIYSHLFLKSIFGRSRPNPDLDNPIGGVYTSDRFDFGNIHRPYFNSRSEFTGFPSFHFTMTFAVAKTLHRIYEFNSIPYIVTSIMLLPAFQAHNHWVSEMVGGALIGTMIGNLVADNYFDSNIVDNKMSFLPLIGNGIQGLSLRMKF